MTEVDVNTTYAFMIRCAIPKVEKRSRPISLKDKSNMLWDSIFRAHRDVLSGRNYLPIYCSKTIDTCIY